MDDATALDAIHKIIDDDRDYVISLTGEMVRKFPPQVSLYFLTRLPPCKTVLMPWDSASSYVSSIRCGVL